MIFSQARRRTRFGLSHIKADNEVWQKSGCKGCLVLIEEYYDSRRTQNDGERGSPSFCVNHRYSFFFSR